MDSYKSQVILILKVLPEVAKESCFALHGGTAINLFVRDMPRLSVDIDLTYIPIEDRETSFATVNKTLERIKIGVESIFPTIEVSHRPKVLKLLFSERNAQIKLEVSQTMRGVIGSPIRMVLSELVQTKFSSFSAINVVPFEQLYGGKICAALDRQHPRDLFDVKYLLENEGFTRDLKMGFLFCLLGSKRPINELLFPHELDQRSALKNKFEGMSKESFTYEEFEETRNRLVIEIHKSLNSTDIQFLLDFENTIPNWELYDFEEFPAVQWKLKNLRKLKNTNPEKHLKQLNQLKELLGEL